MLLYVVCRADKSLFTLSPILWLATAVPGFGLALLPLLIAAAIESGDGAVWVFMALFTLLVSLPTYAFAKAAWAQQLRCRLEGAHLHVTQRGRDRALEAPSLRLQVRQRKFGWQAPLIAHAVSLTPAEGTEEITVHLSLTQASARRAAQRVAEHLGLPSPDES